VERGGVTLGHKGANAAFYSLDGARMPPRPQVGTNGFKRADAGFS